jgi:type 1 fimbria pilin
LSDGALPLPRPLQTTPAAASPRRLLLLRELAACLYRALLACAAGAAAAAAGAAPATFVSGSWFYGLASCGGKPLVPFNFTANACSPLNTTDLQGQFKGQSLRLSQQDPSRASAALDVFADDACSVQPTRWGTVTDGACQMSYYSTKYTFDTKFSTWQLSS